MDISKNLSEAPSSPVGEKGDISPSEEEISVSDLTLPTLGEETKEEKPQQFESKLTIISSLLPVRCYTCGKVIKELTIKEKLKEGMSLREIMDKLGYKRICCRQIIVTAPSIVEIQKQVEEQKETERKLSKLDIFTTGPGQSFIETSLTGSSVKIVDEDIKGEHLQSPEPEEETLEQSFGLSTKDE
jgi:DNA-directed RNA polymerase subunit N (RpoN/RPB10)